jgi:hypothetical protein
MNVTYDKEFRAKAKQQGKGLFTLSVTNTKKQTTTIQCLLDDFTLNRIMNEVNDTLKQTK